MERDVRGADIFESFFLEFRRFSPTSHRPELGVNERVIVMDSVCNLKKRITNYVKCIMQNHTFFHAAICSSFQMPGA